MAPERSNIRTNPVWPRETVSRRFGQVAGAAHCPHCGSWLSRQLPAVATRPTPAGFSDEEWAVALKTAELVSQGIIEPSL